jgi:membrane protein
MLCYYQFMKYFFMLLIQATQLWYIKDSDRMAATVSYYGLFALVPLLFLSVVIASLLYGKVFVVDTLNNWGSVLGPELLGLLQVAVKNLEQLSVGFGWPIFGAIFFSSMVVVMFNTFSTGLTHLWGVSPRSFKNWLKKSCRSVVFIIVFEAYLLCLVLFNLGTQSLLGDAFMGQYILQLLILLVSTTVLFTLAYRILPDLAPSRKACFFGAMVASVLFLVARLFVALYIAITPVPGLYGAAGLILALLIWLYTSTAVVYFGAAFAHVLDASLDKTARN